MSPLGSGFHSPFSVQVAELDPESTSPGGQLNMIVLPSTGILGYSALTLSTESLLTVDNSSECPQLAIQYDSLCECSYAKHNICLTII